MNQTEKLHERIREELRAVDVSAQYDDMLDEIYSLESVGGPFAHMSASRVLKEMDETSYRCGFNDWLDGESERLVEIGDDHFERDEAEEIRDEMVRELEAKLSEVEDEENEEGADLDALKLKAKELQDAVDELNGAL